MPFPIKYSHDEDINCFNCETSLVTSEPKDSEFAPGTGQFRKTCNKCEMHTYYDVKTSEPS